MNIELQKKCKQYRLNEQEYKKACELLGREIQGVEWALFSALWSEHCSYKSSKLHLRKFSYRNKSVMQSSGENAGILDLGCGEKIAFKMESHNHPSFIEPFQGAATGVGGILRDIFTMGARPIALADFLCFGPKDLSLTKRLSSGVVSGISSYGNCVGVPTVTGSTHYHHKYEKNILVNAMAVGLLEENSRVALSKAGGLGNFVVYVGAKTGRDGVHGASMASESFSENSEAKKPNVQIGDPFYEKLLIESCLEVLDADLVQSMQDMGAAGLTSSSFEMAVKGEVGMDIHLDKVPLREDNLTPEEILLSESQERMLLICEPQKYSALQKVFKKWGLDAAKIGEVTKGPSLRLFWRNEVICDLDPSLIVDRAPMYERNFVPYESPNWRPNLSPILTDAKSEVLIKKINQHLSAFAKPDEASDKSWIFRQYDQRVGGKTVFDSSNTISILRLPSGRGLAVSVGCRPNIMELDTRLGAFDSVCYPSLQMAIKGFKVLGITDCLNFGNPEKISVMSDFVCSVDSIALASRELDAPVVSGNVSFYNETLNENIIPTPATGLIGLRDHVDQIPADYFTNENQDVFLLRLKLNQARRDESMNLKEFDGEFDIKAFKAFLSIILEFSLNNPVGSSRVVGGGGLAWTLQKMQKNNVGVEILNKDLSVEDFIDDKFYEVILVLPKSQSDHMFETFSARAKTLKIDSKFEILKIGITAKVDSSFGKINFSKLLD